MLFAVENLGYHQVSILFQLLIGKSPPESHDFREGHQIVLTVQIFLFIRSQGIKDRLSHALVACGYRMDLIKIRVVHHA